MKNRCCIFIMQIIMIICCIVIYCHRENQNVEILSYIGDEYDIAITTGCYSYHRSDLPDNRYVRIFEKGDTYFINSNNINRKLKLNIHMNTQGELIDTPYGFYNNSLYVSSGKKLYTIDRNKTLIPKDRIKNISVRKLNNNYMLYECDNNYYVRNLDSGEDTLIGDHSVSVDENGNGAFIEKGSIILKLYKDDNTKYISNDVSKIIGFRNNKIYFKKTNEDYFIHIYDIDSDSENTCSLKNAYADMYNLNPDTVFSDGNTIKSLFIDHNLDGSEVYSFKFCYNNNLIFTAGKDMEDANKIYMYNTVMLQKTTIFDLSNIGKSIGKVYLLKK